MGGVEAERKTYPPVEKIDNKNSRILKIPVKKYLTDWQIRDILLSDAL